MSQSADRLPCLLALEDGTVFRGRSFGATGTRTGEIVFNTAMTGYQEILTDPSYCGQIIAMTYPLIGNYGINVEDLESPRPFAQGLIVRELSETHSNFRATGTLECYLAEHGLIGIERIDTRALTRQLRVDGAMRGVLTTELDDPATAVRLARESPSMEGADLVQQVAPKATSVWTEGFVDAISPSLDRTKQSVAPLRVVAIDCGMKRSIARHLVEAGCAVTLMPPTSSPGDVLDHRPHGVFVSNGPGDPAVLSYAIELVKGLIGRIPIFGVCLGHQLLGLALGGRTFKLKFGHHGANQPVRNALTGKVEITSQNHGFAVDADSLNDRGCVTTHVNLNDGTLEGFVHRELPILAVQFHPEAGPGPHDAAHLFERFGEMMRTGKAPTMFAQ